MRVVALLARRPGLLVLHDALLADPGLEVAAVFTHGMLPRAAGGGARDEVAEFAALCRRRAVPLHVLDFPQARDIGPRLPGGPLDLLVSLSWRALVPQAVLDRFARGTVNLHRGALPAYGGAEPVRRAIEAGERRAAITAHAMTAEIDAGAILAETWYDLPPCPPADATAAHAERVKTMIEPLYAPLCRLVLAGQRLTGHPVAGHPPAGQRLAGQHLTGQA